MSHDRISDLDPRGLIKDAYAMSTIGKAECRSVFLDWIMGLDQTNDLPDVMLRMRSHYGETYPNHPMTLLLDEGLNMSARPNRRRGRTR